MPLVKKATVTLLAAGALAAFSAATVAQSAVPTGRSANTPPGETLVLPEPVLLDWIEVSKVSALREGVVSKMELQIGMPVKRGGEIGQLHTEIADLTVKKAKVAAESRAAEEKAKAQKDLAAAIVAINMRLNARQRGIVSREEMAKAEAELKVAVASIAEAVDKRKLDEAELALAERTLDEHTIRAPFDGLIVERFKNPEESVRANEPVVLLANLSKIRAWGWVPLEYAFRVKEGMIVEIQPKLSDGGANNPIEHKRFRGKIVFVVPQIQPVAETAVKIYADFENSPELELRKGLRATMTVYLDSDAGPPATAVGARNDQPPVSR